MVAYAEGKDYGRSAQLSCMATAGEGPRPCPTASQLPKPGMAGSSGGQPHSPCCVKDLPVQPPLSPEACHPEALRAPAPETTLSTVPLTCSFHRHSGQHLQAARHAGSGCLVVGSTDGRLRLFDAYNLTRASTTIPGLGCAITHVDVTWDAQHILATTDHFVLLLQVLNNIINIINCAQCAATRGACCRSSPPAPLQPSRSGQ